MTFTESQTNWISNSLDSSSGEFYIGISQSADSSAKILETISEIEIPSGIYEAMYNYWTEVSGMSELECAYGYGDYVDSTVSPSDITSGAQGYGIFWPINHSYLYPYRVSALNGTDSSELSYSEYQQILIEESNQGITPPEPADRLAAQNQQENSISNQIDALNDLIAKLQEESSNYSFISDLISQAQSALSDSLIALTNVQDEISGYPSISGGRSTYLTSRKSQLSARAAEVTSSYMNVYNMRYLWLDALINRMYGKMKSYYSNRKTIEYLDQKISSLESIRDGLSIYA